MSIISLILVIVIMILLVALSCEEAEGCFVVAAGRRASATGRVILGHNEDNCGELIMRHRYIPPTDGGELLSFEKGCAKIYQDGPTLGFFWTETLRPSPGESFGDSFVNEKGVAVVSNTCCRSQDIGPSFPDITGGGIRWGLRAAVAFRASSARDAVRIASELVTEYGYDAQGRSYTFADARDVWVFQVANGRHFAARRVPDDHVMVNPNHYSIREIDPDDGENCVISPGLVEYAISRGWYAPKKRGDPSDFDFAEAFQHPSYIMAPMNTARHSFGFSVSAGVDISLKTDSERPPFSVRPASPVTFEAIYKTLGSHCGDSGEFGWSVTPHSIGGITAGPDDARKNTRICNGGNRESLIVDLTKNPDDTAIWSCFGNPCVLSMTPWHLGSRAIPEPFSGTCAEPGSLNELAKRHFNAAREDLANERPEAWKLSRALVEWCDEDYSTRAKVVNERLKGVRDKITISNDKFESGAPHAREEFFSLDTSHAEFVLESMRSLIRE